MNSTIYCTLFFRCTLRCVGVRILVNDLYNVLNVGETQTIFHLSAKIPPCNDESNLRIKGFLITQVCFKILTSMLSTLPDFCYCLEK